MLSENDVADLEEIYKKMLAILGQDARVSIEQVDDIPVLQSGKRKPVVNNWRNL